MRPYTQRYLMGLDEYLVDPFNCLDAVSMPLVVVALVRMLSGADSGLTAQVSAAGTLLLWVRAHDALQITLMWHVYPLLRLRRVWCTMEQLRTIQYLNGLEATSPFVRSTQAIIADMVPFMIMLGILVVGNRCPILHAQFLYPRL